MKVDNLLEKVISFCSQNDSEIFNLIKEKGLKIVAETIINCFN